eukprot:m51a1_g4072 putative endo- -beta-xylanase (360) ;mRNA; f:758074-759535
MYHSVVHSPYLDLASKHFDIITAENECKIDATEPQQGHFTFDGCDAMLNYAQSHNMHFRGHTLVWHSQAPQWMSNIKDANQLRGALVSHVNGVLGHYKGKAYAWDVVNEAVADDGKGLRQSFWYPLVPDFIDLAFKTARNADPSAKLFYNDYGADSIWQQKSTYIYNMVKSMKERGIPIDGVGFQMHVSTNWSPSQEDIRKNLQRFADLGLEVHITETDVGTNGPSEWDKQAQIYANVANACLAVSTCKSYMVWGVVDKYSWLKPADVKTGLIFDSNYTPKPAACSIYDAFIKAAPQAQSSSRPAPQSSSHPEEHSSARPHPHPVVESSDALPDSTFNGISRAVPAALPISLALAALRL